MLLDNIKARTEHLTNELSRAKELISKTEVIRAKLDVLCEYNKRCCSSYEKKNFGELLIAADRPNDIEFIQWTLESIKTDIENRMNIKMDLDYSKDLDAIIIDLLQYASYCLKEENEILHNALQ